MPLTSSADNILSQTLATQGAFIGVGDGTAAFSNTQTDLQGTNKYRQAVDAGFPQVSGNTVTYQATFPASVANYAWNEWGVFTAGGTMISRKVETVGTKPNNQSWQFTVTLTVT
ncbi:MAG TPA: phage tail protein [Candidatus Limnocylindrales bacterium]|nr:phage tail protein [Candidatus Limnocylindrales bacterium]